MLKKNQPVKFERPMSTMRQVYLSIEQGNKYRGDIQADTKLLQGQVQSALWNLVYIGAVVLKTAIELTDLPGTVTTNQLIDASVNQMPRDEDAKRDRRRELVIRGLEALVSANRISTVGGEVQVL
jgi:hypothetical protein